MIFVNSSDFARRVFDMLRDIGHKPSLIMGGDMTNEERDEEIEKFRKGLV